MAGVSLMSLLWFALVLVLIPVGLLLLQRSSLGRRLASRNQPAGLVVGSTSLGPQQRLLAIEVGDGADKRWLLLGVTPHQITHLLTADSPFQSLVDMAPPPPPASFQQVLARWRAPTA